MFSLEKIQELFNDSEDFIVQGFIMAVNYGDVKTVDGILESIKCFLEEKRQDDLLELVDYYLENHVYSKSDDEYIPEDFFICPYFE